MYSGSCLCGRVTFQLEGGIHSIIHCHCSLCRKSTGTAYATNGFIQRDGFRLLSGAEVLGDYETSPGRRRHFCGVCASPIYSSNAADPERLRIRLGALDSEISERPVAHTFVDSMASWDDLDGELPRYPEYESGRT